MKRIRPFILVIFAILLALFLFAIEIRAEPSDSRIVATPEYLVFHSVEGESDSLVQTFTITNGGEGTLNYILSGASSWFSMDSSSGSVSTGENTIIVTLYPSGLSSTGSPYIEDIIINNIDIPEDTKKIRVRLSILSEEAYVRTYEYDSNGNLVRRITPDGDIIEYRYNSLNRLIHVYYPDGSEVSYEYDANGNRTKMIDSHGETCYAYDEFNRLEGVQFPGINPIYYEYDRAGNITKITYPNQEEVIYTYDDDNRLWKVTNAAGTTTYEYDNNTNNLIKKTLPNGVYTEYDYDTAKRIKDVKNKKSDGTPISRYQYKEYDANNNIEEVIETTSGGDRTIGYTYDKLNRLTNASYSDGTYETYTYDATGNRLTKTTQDETIEYQYDSDNRLIRAGDTIFFYDKSGNQIKKVSPDKTEQYEYDYNNKLIRYEDGTNIVEFEYDGDGNRISKTVNGKKTRYINDINRPLVQVLLETDAGWRVKKSYTYGLDRLSQKEY